MTRYYCDICGKPFNPMREGRKAEQVPADAGVFGFAQNGLDVCRACMDVGREVDYHAAMERAWREAVDVSLQSV